MNKKNSIQEVKLISEGRACVELNDRQRLFYDAGAGHWWLEITATNGAVSTVILREDVLDELYNKAWGDDL